MSYRILEIDPSAPQSLEEATEVAQYDSAYRAMERMRRAFILQDCVPPGWYLVDPSGEVLLGPHDLYDVAA